MKRKRSNQTWWQRRVAVLSEKTRRQPQSLPPFSRKTWPLYADITIQTVKSLAYYFIGALFIGGCFAGGLLAGYFASIIDQTPVPTKAAMTKTLNNVSASTTLYWAKNVEISHVKSDLIRDTVSIDKMSPWVQKAIIATEDENFYQHSGVVPKALVRALVSEVTGIGSQTGGSTLTQQVVKMQYLSNETTFKRKAIEIMYALRLNHYFSKQEILQEYLNIATLGRNNKGQNIAGVQTAAKGLFGVDAAHLTLPQAAYIAGLPQSPSVYTPYTITGSLKPAKELAYGLDRQKTVLFRMYRAGSITKKQYTDAKAYDLKKDFLPQQSANSATQKYSYVYNMVYDQAIEVLAKQLAQTDGHSESDYNKNSALAQTYEAQAEELLTTKGYQVTSTLNKTVYDTMQTVLANNKNSFGQTYTSTETDPKTGEPTTITEPVQNGSILLDNDTGAVLGFIGGVSGELNHIYTTRSPGSSIKPLLVYGPAIENKLIGSETMLADFPNNFVNYSVTDYGNTIQNRFLSATEALKWSYNVPAVHLYDKVRQTVSVKKYMDAMGITTLTDRDYQTLGLALGGSDYGLTVQENASAFSTFARGGTHVDAYVIDKIVDPLGKVIYQHKKPKATPVFSKATAYIMQQMMHNVVSTGTAATLSWQLNFNDTNVFGKTGTSNDYKDLWFVGSTPGVTLASWIGYDNNNGTAHTLSTNASQYNINFWAALANAIYAKIPQSFKLTDSMARPSTVKSVKVNAYTGLPAADVSFDGTTYKLSANTLTSLYNDWEPSKSTANFAIGGNDEDYKLFWQHLTGANNGYGVVSKGNKRATVKKSTTSASTTEKKKEEDADKDDEEDDTDEKETPSTEDKADTAATTSSAASSSSSQATTSSERTDTGRTQSQQGNTETGTGSKD
ncbi:transglycosylase domain-containing protein [Lacticaseibacillus mingshuiensis]|uniref:transglycosylase domain-containing protein n=1 Tax=Lacticaseibacillus mingshuiensis TaxID=2799574 RepID=UPI00194DF288|nr:transglycosylase domain-containing protein [Lacticaseibacillus mingshuiensis]